MSLRIIKAGVLDTIQDGGRYGHQHLGINPNGAMDRFSSRLANALLGKDLNAPVLELHYPAAQLLFEKETVICLTGGDFTPIVNGLPVPMNHPIALKKNSLLQFTGNRAGARVYVSILSEWKLDPWMNSCSTNLKAGAGGLLGRALLKNDVLFFEATAKKVPIDANKDFVVLPWKAADVVDFRNEIECLIGSEWQYLNAEAQTNFQNQWFQVTNEADRMGYRLAGSILLEGKTGELLSSGVSFGTIQLLPAGQLIILMADHQTTGGYPRIAYVISAHLPLLAQKKPNDVIRFKITTLEEAERKLLKQEQHLRQLQLACKYRLEEMQ